MVVMEITDDILRGFHPKNYYSRKVISGTYGESKKGQQRTEERNSESVIIVEDVLEKINTCEFIVLTPHTVIFLVLCTLIFSLISPLDQSPLCPAALITLLLIILDSVKKWNIFIAVLTFE